MLFIEKLSAMKNGYDICKLSISAMTPHKANNNIHYMLLVGKKCAKCSSESVYYLYIWNRIDLKIHQNVKAQRIWVDNHTSKILWKI